jgi:hypothetical protein
MMDVGEPFSNLPIHFKEVKPATRHLAPESASRLSNLFNLVITEPLLAPTMAYQGFKDLAFDG